MYRKTFEPIIVLPKVNVCGYSLKDYHIVWIFLQWKFSLCNLSTLVVNQPFILMGWHFFRYIFYHVIIIIALIILPKSNKNLNFLYKVYADQEQKKVGIFDRLEQTKKTSSFQPQIKITGLNNVATSSSSIFSRLGGKSDDIEMDDEKAVAFAGILKSAPKKVRFIFWNETIIILSRLLMVY